MTQTKIVCWDTSEGLKLLSLYFEKFLGPISYLYTAIFFKKEPDTGLECILSYVKQSPMKGWKWFWQSYSEGQEVSLLKGVENWP
jgi:hypothetical protein